MRSLTSSHDALYTAAVRWHFSGVRFLLTLPIVCALFCASCASPEKKAERAQKLANSRVVESQKMRALDYGDVASKRGADMLVVDPEKSFDLGNAATGSTRSFNTGKARVKDFNYEQKVTTQSYNARSFFGAKQSAFSDQRFATRAARTTGNYEIPNAAKKADTKTAVTKDAREANKTMATRDMPGGDRRYLGKEAEKMKKSLDPNARVGWSGDLKEMSIDDLRDLLNKNK